MARAPRSPAAWFHQGTAFHTAVEFWERNDWAWPTESVVELYQDEYDRLVAEDMEREPNLSRWLTGGRVKAADDISRRRERGAEQVRAYIAYATQAPERVWNLPEGDPALEVEFELDLDGVRVKGFIDQIIQWPTGQVGPRDLKTGSKRPEWPLQLVIYGLAIEELFGFRPKWGDFYIAKDGKPDSPVDLSGFTREKITRWFHEMDSGVRAGVFVPNVGDHCRVCLVSDFCSAIGKRSNEFPPIPQEVKNG